MTRKKKQGPTYRKVVNLLWRDPDFLRLPQLGKLIVFNILTGPQSNGAGIFCYSIGSAREEVTFGEALGQTLAQGSEVSSKPTSEEEFRNAFFEVLETFSWEYDEASRVLWVRSWWKYNKPDGINQMIGALGRVPETPASPLDALFFNHIEHLSGKLGAAFQELLRKRYPKRFGRGTPSPPAKGGGIQEQEQEQEQEDNALSGARETDDGDEPEPDANRFWNAYPEGHRGGDYQFHRAWFEQGRRLPPVDELLEILEAWKRSARWIKDDGEFIPAAANFIRRGLWADRPKPASKRSGRPKASAMPAHGSTGDGGWSE